MLHSQVRKAKSTIDGYGLYADGHILAGEIVWQLDPEEHIMTKDELSQLNSKEQERAYPFQDGFILTHDNGEHMNHSCNPNVWWENDRTLTAARDIAAGEEITYDYATTDIESDYEAPWHCSCSSPQCRQRVSAQDCLDPAFQKRYRGHLPSWTLEYIRSQKNIS